MIKAYSLNNYDTEPHDAKLYYFYGKELASHGKIPKDSSFLHNLGFPLLLAPVFKIFDYPYEESMTIQKYVTVIISSATIPLMYIFTRNYFDWRLSLVGALFIAFDPRIIQNSTLGITEPLYLFLFISSLILFKRNIYLCFFVAGLACVTRFEGLILLPILFVLLYGNIRKKRNIVLPFIFLLPIILVLLFYLSSGTNHIEYEVNREIKALVQITDDQRSITNKQPLFLERIANSFVYFGWFTFPMFFFFIPLAFYLNRKNKGLILILAISASTGLWAYLDAFDTRYFFHMYPFLLLLILPAFRFLFDKEKVKPIERES